MKIHVQTIIAAVLALSACTGSLREAGNTRVIDADTLDVSGQRIRLHGIDAPEGAQTCTLLNGREWYCGRAGAQALKDKIGGSPVVCETKDIDRYRRIVAVCRAEGVDRLVEQGWALAYREYSRDYVAAEAEALAARRGVWSGEFQMPWDWRRAQRS